MPRSRKPIKINQEELDAIITAAQNYPEASKEEVVFVAQASLEVVDSDDANDNEEE